MAKCSKTIAKNIQRRLDQLGISQSELARRVGMTGPYINQILREKNQSPALDTLEKIADALGYSMVELLTSRVERDALSGHDAVDCFERVGEILALARDGHEAEALAILKKRKPRA